MRAVLSLILSALPLVACSAAPPTASTPPPSASAPAETVPVIAPASATPAPSVLPTVAVRSASTGELPLEFAVRELRVEGGLTTLTWSVTNRDETERWFPEGTFGDGIYQEGVSTRWAPAEMPGTSTDGVYLLDRANARRYPPARDGENGCVCSDLSGTRIVPGQTILVHAVYQALPPSVSSVDVAIPLAGVFTRVPVTR